jgi:hypothetical protein
MSIEKSAKPQYIRLFRWFSAVLARIPEFALSQPRIEPMELNPGILRSDGATVVDATITTLE